MKIRAFETPFNMMIEKFDLTFLQTKLFGKQICERPRGNFCKQKFQNILCLFAGEKGEFINTEL